MAGRALPRQALYVGKKRNPELSQQVGKHIAAYSKQSGSSSEKQCQNNLGKRSSVGLNNGGRHRS